MGILFLFEVVDAIYDRAMPPGGGRLADVWEDGSVWQLGKRDALNWWS